jgi:hypothetical protein
LFGSTDDFELVEAVLLQPKKLDVKGGLIAEFFSLWLKSSQKGAKTLLSTFLSLLRQGVQESDFNPF